MKQAFAISFSLFFLFSCGDNTQHGTNKNEIREFVPEPGRAERLREEALQRFRKSDCTFLYPDTSVLSVKLRDAQSGKAFIRNEKHGSQEQYHFYSNNYQQLLSLTQHPGDAKYQVSIFRVEYAKKDDYGYRRLPVDTIKTEKGIMLGMPKKDIVSQLGTCYEAFDSTEAYMELYYRIESPKDTKTHLLANQGMPVYFASYKIRNGELEAFEFGFDYP